MAHDPLDPWPRPVSALLSLAVLALACGVPEPDGSSPIRDEPESGSGGPADDEGSTEAGASTDRPEDGTTDGGSQDETGSDETGPGSGPITEDARNYIFGHSLILHAPEANVPRWLHALSQQAGYGYGMSGQYGFADTHAADLPPDPQWGIEGVTSLWDDDDGQAFEDVDFNVVLFTEANFRQYYPPTEPDPDGILPESSVQSTTTVFDWVEAAEPGVRYVLYENWPDMSAFTSADFGATFPTEDELSAYYAYTSGEFHQWWLDYHDAMMEVRPGLDVRMIPVGPIVVELLGSILSDVPPEVLYEDDAPHGRPTLYFLAGLVTYMGMYGVEAPSDFVVPESIDARVAERYGEIVADIWAQLQQFDDGDGRSRVF
ncbi:MAG: T9SS C-terminal target domain-containing protein [Myxococcota bacterium]